MPPRDFAFTLSLEPRIIFPLLFGPGFFWKEIDTHAKEWKEKVHDAGEWDELVQRSIAHLHGDGKTRTPCLSFIQMRGLTTASPGKHPYDATSTNTITEP